MKEVQECPICLKEHDRCEDITATIYYCNEGKYTSVIDESVVFNCSSEEKEKRLNAIFNFIFDRPRTTSGKYWKFIYKEDEEYDEYFTENSKDGRIRTTINVKYLLNKYPKTLHERVDAILLNLAKLHPKFFTNFNIHDMVYSYPRLFYFDDLLTNNVYEHNTFTKILASLKYIEQTSDVYQGEFTLYTLTPEAWKRIEYLKENIQTSKNIFIAMSFDKSVEYIENAFKEAIKATGYTPIIIKDKEHNNYIMPEIFYAIEHAAGVVVDVTKENLGVYYEAGYALGKKKEVIVCCKEEIFKDPEKKPHFDIAQKSMIIWKDEKDLIERLKSRINATIK